MKTSDLVGVTLYIYNKRRLGIMLPADETLYVSDDLDKALEEAAPGCEILRCVGKPLKTKVVEDRQVVVTSRRVAVDDESDTEPAAQ